MENIEIFVEVNETFSIGTDKPLMKSLCKCKLSTFGSTRIEAFGKHYKAIENIANIVIMENIRIETQMH